MSYTDTFSAQWDTLVSNFAADTAKLPPEVITLGKVSEWYRVNSFCWCSIVEPEGMLLDQQNNDELTKKLTDAIRGFSFEKKENDLKKPCISGYLISGAVMAAAACVLLRVLLHAAVWKLILLAMIIVTLPFLLLAPRLDKYHAESVSRLTEGYASQLRDYKQTLLDICGEFEEEEIITEQ